MPIHQSLVVPDVHLNGSGREALVEQRKEARNALYKALGLLCEMRPHGRDYFNVHEYKAAREYHEKRIQAVNTIIDELATEAYAIQCQGR